MQTKYKYKLDHRDPYCNQNLTLNIENFNMRIHVLQKFLYLNKHDSY